MMGVREALPSDVPLIVALIHELADFEKLSHECMATEALIMQWLFSESPRAYSVIAEWEGEAAGFGLYFYNFSTFLSKPGIYIEDLFVRPAFRRKGIARQLFAYLAKKAMQEDCGRLEWWVLDWNRDAIAFYKGIGAKAMDEWTVQRVEGDALRQLASLG